MSEQFLVNLVTHLLKISRLLTSALRIGISNLTDIVYTEKAFIVIKLDLQLWE